MPKPYYLLVALLLVVGGEGGCVRSGFTQPCEGGACADASVADVPMTDAPTTDAAMTDVPTTDVPMTDAPITDVPMTDAPMTDVPMTDVPMTDAPTTDAATTASCADQAQVNDSVQHGLIVAEAGGAAVSDRLELGQGTYGFVPLVTPAAGGILELEQSGQFTFTPGDSPTTENLQIEVNGPVSVLPACLRVQVIDTSGAAVLVGASWDDSNAWEPPGRPAPGAVIYIRPGVHDLGNGATVDEIFVSSGATLDLTMALLPALSVGSKAWIGGRITGGLTRVSGSVGGRFTALACSGATTLHAATRVLLLDDALPGCQLDLGGHRLGVEQDLTLDGTGNTLFMNQRTSRLEVQGDISAALESSALSAGIIVGSGSYRIDLGGSGPVGNHHVVLTGPGIISISSPSFAWLTLPPAGGEAVFSSGADIAFFSVGREVTVLSGQLQIEELHLSFGFSTTTPEAFVVTGTCNGMADAGNPCEGLGPP